MSDYHIIYSTEYSSITQGTWVYVNNANDRHRGVYRNSTNADGDKICYDDIYLNAGTWRIDISGRQVASHGILKIDIDGTEVASHDQYGATTYNVRYSTTGIAIATAGFKNIDVYVSGKNASSSDHYIAWSYICFRRTAA